MFGNIASSLGIGSGLNTSQLVNDLASAVRQPKDATLRAKETQNSARISALSAANGALGTFGSALRDLLSGAAFAGTPRSSDDGVIAVSLLPGGRPTSSAASLRVVSLAAPQLSRSDVYNGPNAIIGGGSLSITSGGSTLNVDIADPLSSLADVAAAINRSASSAGALVRARLVTDISGSRMVLNGAEGAANAFTLNAGSTASTGLQSLASGMATTQSASNAAIEMDGLPLSFSSNIIDGAISGLRMTLKTISPPPGAAPPVSIAADIPADGLKSLLGDFVKAYNDLRSGLNSATAAGGSNGTAGPLAGDPAVRTMMSALGRMTTQALTDTGTLRSLSDIGVKTERNGTLLFDAARFDSAASGNLDALRNIINPAQPSAAKPGLSGLFDAVLKPLQASDGPLIASKRKYEAAQKNYAALREKLDQADDQYRQQLNRSFTAMERQLTVLRATQSYVQQQIAAWNSNNS